MTPTLLAFLDDVEHNRIPADEVRHRARLARNAFKAALAEAVRAEREACAAIIENESRAVGIAWDIGENWRWRNKLVSAIRSRPSPDVAVVPQISPATIAEGEALRNWIDENQEREDYYTARDFQNGLNYIFKARLSSCQPSTPPPDLAAMRRVVEAAPTAPRPWSVRVDPRGYVHVIDAKSMPIVRISNVRDLENATAIANLMVDSVNARGQEADHDR